MSFPRRGITRYLWAVTLLLSVSTGARQATAQTGSFSGTIFTEPSEKALPNAEVVFSDLKRTVRSDSAGNFLLSGLPLGKHSVVVRLVGYEPITTLITLVDAKPLEVDLFLKQTTTVLKNVEVTAAAPYAARLVDFEERRKTGGGRFITAEFFEQQGGRPMSAFLKQKIPSITFVRNRLGEVQLATNARSVLKGADCFVQVVVNGVVRSGAVDLDRDFNTLDIIGLEFYSASTTPAQYNNTRGNLGCGTLIIWTKG